MHYPISLGPQEHCLLCILWLHNQFSNFNDIIEFEIFGIITSPTYTEKIKKIEVGSCLGTTPVPSPKQKKIPQILLSFFHTKQKLPDWNGYFTLAGVLLNPKERAHPG